MNCMASQSGKTSKRLGRRKRPANTTSVMPCSRASSTALPGAPMRTHSCGVPTSAAASAWPLTATTKTSRPSLRQASINRCGSVPPPATMPSLLDIPRPGLADGAARIRAYERNDLHHGLVVVIDLLGVRQAFRHAAFLREEEPVGRPQRVNL